MKYDFEIDINSFDAEEYLKKYAYKEDFTENENSGDEIIEDYRSFAYYDVF